MISEVDTVEYPLDEEASTVQLLIDGMYNANMAVIDGNVEQCLELARKYDVVDMLDNCARFLHAVPLTVQNVPRWLALARNTACKLPRRGARPSSQRAATLIPP